MAAAAAAVAWREVADMPPERSTLAPLHLRLFAAAFDLMVLNIALAPIYVVLALLDGLPPSGDTGPLGYAEFWREIRPFAVATLGVSVAAVFGLACFDAGERGATPGKRLVGIRVADRATGGPIGLRRALLRRLIFGVEGLPLYAGYWWVLVGDRREAWHDKAARTAVVRASGELPGSGDPEARPLRPGAGAPQRQTP